MNNNINTLNRIAEIINKGRSGVIIIPPNPSIDAIASSTALYLGLNKIGKSISVACSSKVEADLIGSDKFKNIISAEGDALMISFPYSDGSIDKVDYNIQGEFFNLIITPREGYPKLNPNQVKYSYTGGTVDFLIVIDSATLNNLGEIYTNNQAQFTGKDIINIDRHLTNAYFGTVNLVDKTISSVSELILKILQTLKIEIDKDMATNLYAGISASTNNFTSYSTNANTFENIATLLRLGAIKKTIKKPEAPKIFSGFTPPSPSPIRQSYSQSPEIQPTTPIEKVEKEKQPAQSNFEQNQPQNPSEVLKPKIFKNGGGLI
ncbi:MAG: DHH family phosphoesterase [Patescibacteria group bacterium]|nr:DHH family phosphoesterase [Patescibacteria group bacterium]